MKITKGEEKDESWNGMARGKGKRREDTRGRDETKNKKGGRNEI